MTVRSLAGRAIQRVAGVRPDPTSVVSSSTSPGTPGDPGLFGPGSVTWSVHSDLSVLVGGLRALLVQALHPLAMAGVAQHSDYRADPLGRLERTARFVAATTYGTTPEAQAAIDTIRRVHRRVRGTTADGRPYDATDPRLLSWVHNVEVDSFLTAYRAFGPGLDDEASDRYVAEMTAVGRLVGADELPTDRDALRSWVAGVEDLEVTADARAVVRFLALPPLPLRLRPFHAAVFWAAAGLVPWRWRVALGLPVGGSNSTPVRPAVRMLVRSAGRAFGPSPTRAAAERRCRNAPAA